MLRNDNTRINDNPPAASNPIIINTNPARLYRVPKAIAAPATAIPKARAITSVMGIFSPIDSDVG
jgi:hypothetical protein